MKTHLRGSDLPDYASQILAFRKRLQMTQPQLAEALKMKRGTVAQWEGGVREPKIESYSKLAEFATARGLADFSRFFALQMGRKADEGHGKREARRARRYLALMRREAATGDERAKHLLALSELDFTGYMKDRMKRIDEAKRTLANGKLVEFFAHLSSEVHEVGLLTLGRQSAIEEGLKRTERRPHKAKRHK